MSRSTPSQRPRGHAPLFAALGDETRLALLAKLGDGQQRSISQLTEGSAVTRQAITKHLRVLERARIVRCTLSGHWDAALHRLRSFVESNHPG
jgi:DNA-binding transcriptional ArsR family regulator